MTVKIYPRYHLWWQTKRGVTKYHSRRKKAFLLRLDRLHTLRTLLKFGFSVEYLKDKVNESVDYKPNQTSQAQKDARVFTAADDVKFITNYWR